MKNSGAVKGKLDAEFSLAKGLKVSFTSYQTLCLKKVGDGYVAFAVAHFLNAVTSR